jgi:CO/xanthine dehydrogenase Mo-binding subunit
MSRRLRSSAPRSARHAVGKNVPRAEGREKLTGEARYVDDLHLPDILYGRTVRSSIPKGRILSVTLDPAFDWSGFTVVDHKDIPGKNVVAMILDDQPYLAVDRVNHQAEPILLLAHAERARLDEGLKHVQVRYQEEPAVLELDSATQVMKEIRIEKGGLAAGFAEAEVIVEGSYATGHQEQLYIEPNGVIALPEIDGNPAGITVYGSLQCPYYVVKALKTLLGLAESEVRVVQMTTGGGFGGKEEYPSVIAGHAALLAKKAKRPVKMIYDRVEDMVATTKRHPSQVRIKSGHKRDGRLTAMQIDLRLDGGAYVTLSPVVLSRAAIHATGPYLVPHVQIHARAYVTHTPPNGAFRGFGAPQSQFAAELHMDRAAQKLAIDPVELRRRNLLQSGDLTATGQKLTDSVSAAQVLDRALKLHARKTKKKKRGCSTGVALFFHGSGFTGGGEVRLASRAGLQLEDKGVRLLCGSTEIGQGTRTMHAQIVADALGIPYSMVETSDPDTARVPDSGPTVASRTCMVVGRILERAAHKLKAALGPYRSPKQFTERARALLREHGRFQVIEQYEKPGQIEWSDETYKGDAYGAYAWGCNVADVEIDPATYEARCTDLTTVIDIGKAIHPILAEGQIEGGTLQAVGWALYEQVVMRDGKMANAQLTNYIIPTTLDTPRLHVEIVENPYKNGPFGAKGVGECPMDGPAAAIVNAINRSLEKRRIDAIPATPEAIMKAFA